MSTKPDGGPAYPVAFTTTPLRGMSLRDYLAAKAMQGMLACPVQLASDQYMTARDAYAVADAMLAERAK